MKSSSKKKLVEFIDYAFDAEGMRFELVQYGHNRYGAIPAMDYDPEMVQSVEKSFNEDWSAFGD